MLAYIERKTQYFTTFTIPMDKEQLFDQQSIYSVDYFIDMLVSHVG